MQNHAAGIVVLIPALEPDSRLTDYAARLLESGFGRVVAVDDGSSAAAQPVFDAIEQMPGCTVLHHDVNHGKGVALKTGYRWILENCPDCTGVLTADADGQHTVPDCLKLADAVAEGKRALYLGSRDFTLPHVPPRSRKGNRITSTVFKALYGIWLPDTQTGLRAFLREDLPFMAEVEGDRYEYEMNVLIACSRAGLPMVPITIETVYENDNEGSHFHPVRDSWRIYKVILGGFLRFTAASIISFAVDHLLFNLLLYLLMPKLNITGGLDISISNYTARLFSSVLNFALNKNYVFRSGSLKQSAWKYAVTCVLIIIMSTLGIKLLHSLGMAEWLAKLICETLLYFLSFRIQQNWVFKGEDHRA